MSSWLRRCFCIDDGYISSSVEDSDDDDDEEEEEKIERVKGKTEVEMKEKEKDNDKNVETKVEEKVEAKNEEKVEKNIEEEEEEKVATKSDLFKRFTSFKGKPLKKTPTHHHEVKFGRGPEAKEALKPSDVWLMRKDDGGVWTGDESKSKAKVGKARDLLAPSFSLSFPQIKVQEVESGRDETSKFYPGIDSDNQVTGAEFNDATDKVHQEDEIKVDVVAAAAAALETN